MTKISSKTVGGASADLQRRRVGGGGPPVTLLLSRIGSPPLSTPCLFPAAVLHAHLGPTPRQPCRGLVRDEEVPRRWGFIQWATRHSAASPCGRLLYTIPFWFLQEIPSLLVYL